MPALARSGLEPAFDAPAADILVYLRSIHSPLADFGSFVMTAGLIAFLWFIIGLSMLLRVVLVFRTAADWQSLRAGAIEPVCLRTLRTKTEILTLDRASHLVQQRMRVIAARKRRQAKPKPLGPLLDQTPT